MKWMILVSAILAFAPALTAEEKALRDAKDYNGSSAIVYPDDPSESLLMDSQYAPKNGRSQQEYVEVTAPDYPGLKFDLPSLRNLITVPRQSAAYPTHDPSYYQEGGMILAYWGFPMPSSQIISTAVPEVP